MASGAGVTNDTVHSEAKTSSAAPTRNNRRIAVSGHSIGDSALAARLRRELPQSENVLRSVVEALGSLAANANPAILVAELALTPWKRKS